MSGALLLLVMLLPLGPVSAPADVAVPGVEDTAERGWTDVTLSESLACGLRDGGTLACWGIKAWESVALPPGTYSTVSAGANHWCGLLFTGRLVCSGDSSRGATQHPSGRFVMVDSGEFHSCALRIDRTVTCWGQNLSGQASPDTGEIEFLAVSAGKGHSCGVTTVGRAVCWGADTFGQSSPPDEAFVAVSAGDDLTCGIRSNGTVRCWGANTFGQSSPPDGTFVAVSAGLQFACGVRTTGAIACWGRNADGQSSPPDETFVGVAAGVKVACGVRTTGAIACWGKGGGRLFTPPSRAFESVAAGGGHVCGLRLESTVQCFGNNTFGQSTPPGDVFRSVSAGWFHSCGVRVDDSVVCWGRNVEGQSSPPGDAFRSVSAGESHSCGVRVDDSVVCWGRNVEGQSSPPDGNFDAVSAGYRHSCAVRTDELLACWGLNNAGQSSAPSGEFVSVSVGNSHSCALRVDRTVRCWGEDTFEAPPVAGNFAAISSGGDFDCGIRLDGWLQCWGATAVTGSQPAPPGPPAAVGAAAGVESASVVWVPSLFDGYREISEYVVTSSPGGRTCVALPDTGGCVVGGLNGGVTYTFTVRARNEVGLGPASVPSNPVTVESPPAGTHSLLVRLLGPGRATVTSAPSGISCGASCDVPFAAGSTVTLRALPDAFSMFVGWSGDCAGRRNECTVQLDRARSVAALFVAAPFAVAGNGSVAVSWSTAFWPRLASISGFEVQRSDDGGLSWTSHYAVRARTSSLTVKRLKNGRAYTFRVRALSSLAKGEWFEAPLAVPRTVPSQPRALRVTSQNNSLDVSWAPPATDGGMPLTEYRVQSSTDGKVWSTVAVLGAYERSHTMTGLINGVKRYVRVIAANVAGPGPAAVSSKVAPRAPLT